MLFFLERVIAMVCQRCGYDVPPGAAVCQNCGSAVAAPNYPPPGQQVGYPPPGQQPGYPPPPPGQQPGYPPQGQYRNYQQMNYRGNVNSYIPQAILLMIFCCLPFGIVSLVYSCRVNSLLERNDYEGAKHASLMSRIWAWVALGSGFVFWDTVAYFFCLIAEVLE